jgi:antibiotic biosynthesis monooxygenase (ABM) superfamily enzyme
MKGAHLHHNLLVPDGCKIFLFWLQSVQRRFWLEVDEGCMGSHEEVEASQKMALTLQHPSGFHFLSSFHK